MAKEPKLYPEDQARVDAYLQRGYNTTERKPFRPGRYILFLIGVVTFISIASLWYADSVGLY